MLDEMTVLRNVAAAYRAAATAAGITWPDRPDTPHAEPPDLVYRLFDVNHVAEQLIWLQQRGWDSQQILPEGGFLLPWPTDVGETLRSLHFSIATPFPWRHQMPLFFFGEISYTFVLDGEHEGEIWRYEHNPDTWGSVRAASSLAALFTAWTAGITAGVVSYAADDRWLHVGDGVHDPFDVLLERVPDLDPFAFPVAVPYTQEPLLRARQQACGVDMDCIERGYDCYEELVESIDATQASLRG